MSEKTIAPEEEVKDTENIDEPEEHEEEVQDEPRDKTVGELLDEDKNDKTVPLSTFLEVKNEKKALEKDIAKLQKQIESGATKSEVTAELKDIADKYDVDPKFLDELSTAIYSKARVEVEEKLKERLQPIEAKEKKERIDKAFNEHFNKVIEEMPEYADVINKDVIKELSLLPQNANKTFQQIIEETYRNSVPGKKTMETSTPRGGKDASLDKARALRDPEYFKQVMADPELKRQYNEGIENRINL